MVDFNVVIPARFGSTRLPGKALLDIAGKPMVIRVAEQSAKSGAQQVLIATDHESVMAAAHKYGYEACLTGAHHISGTDRLAEVIDRLAWPDHTIVVNVQGDEPLISPVLIRAVVQHLDAHPECAIATACHPIQDKETMCNPNVVKVVLDKQENALYFSRASIPFPRAAQDPDWVRNVAALGHIGIYAYRASFLRIFCKLDPVAIEKIEALEQLRALWYGYKIGVTISAETPHGGVDTERDLHVTRKLYDGQRIMKDKIHGSKS